MAKKKKQQSAKEASVSEPQIDETGSEEIDETEEQEETEGQGSEEQLEPASDLSEPSAAVEILREDGTVEKVEPELLETVSEPILAELLNPGDLAVDKAGNLYCSRGHKIIKIDIFGGTAVIAGADEAGYSGDDGPAENALLNAPCSIAISGDRIFILDSGNGAIRVIRQGIITTHATL